MKKTRVNYAHVAELAREALGLGVAASGHVAARLDMNVKTANVAIFRARQAGHDIPALPRNPEVRGSHTVPKRRRGATEGMALRCTDCTRTYPVYALLDLHKHARREHGRFPFREEKTPR